MTTPAPVQDLSQWHAPSTRPEDMHELIHGVGELLPLVRRLMIDRYNPTNLSFMEDYLMSQVREGTYDLLANLAILKLYVYMYISSVVSDNTGTSSTPIYQIPKSSLTFSSNRYLAPPDPISTSLSPCYVNPRLS